jgi:hypothetical protein
MRGRGVSHFADWEPWVEPENDSPMCDAIHRALTGTEKGVPMKVVTIEIAVNAASDLEAENVVLDLLERERRETDAAQLVQWQTTGVAPGFSEQAKPGSIA